MVDMTVEVCRALRARHLDPQYAYPQEWRTVPVVAYWESSNIEKQHADDRELTSIIRYNIDIWAKTPEDTHSISVLADLAMQGLGFRRVACYDLFESDIGTALHHRNMVYETVAVNT